MTAQTIDVGPLEPLLADPAVTLIEATAQQVRYKKAGRSFVSEVAFDSADQLSRVTSAILQAGGVTVASGQQVTECVLADGTQVQAQMEPLRLTLRKAVAPA